MGSELNPIYNRFVIYPYIVVQRTKTSVLPRGVIHMYDQYSNGSDYHNLKLWSLSTSSAPPFHFACKSRLRPSRFRVNASAHRVHEQRGDEANRKEKIYVINSLSPNQLEREGPSVTTDGSIP